MLKTLFLFTIFLFNFQSNDMIQADFADELALSFRQGNTKEIAKSFAPSVELIVIDQEDVYNKAQAEQIIKDFFLKNPPSKVTIIHRLSNNPNYRLAVLSLISKNDKFRITVTMKKSSNAFLITELRLESER